MSICIKPAEAKRCCNMAHARTRGEERYGLSLTNGDLDGWAEKIEGDSEDAVVLQRDPSHPNRDWVACHVNGEWLPAVYDRATRSVVTWLPAYAIDRWRASLKAMKAEPKFVPFVISRPLLPLTPTQSRPAIRRGRPKTWAEGVARRKELAAENCVSRSRYEIAKNSEESRRLKRAMHKAQERANFMSMDVGENPDAAQLLRAARTALSVLLSRLNYESSEDVDKVRNAIHVYLRDNAPILPSDFEEVE